MFWFTQMMCYNVYIPLLVNIYKASYVHRCRVLRFMLFLISITKNPILYSIFKLLNNIFSYILLNWMGL